MAATVPGDTLVEAMAEDPIPRQAAGGAERAPARPARLRRMLEEGRPACVWCARELAPGDRDASVEHVVPRLKGGPAWPENEVVACRACNRARGHTAPVAWLAACEERGLRPDRARIEATLLALEAAIARRGGQRRARPYLDGQLRRLGLGGRRRG
jgi:hypothetical protein